MDTGLDGCDVVAVATGGQVECGCATRAARHGLFPGLDAVARNVGVSECLIVEVGVHGSALLDDADINDWEVVAQCGFEFPNVRVDWQIDLQV